MLNRLIGPLAVLILLASCQSEDLQLMARSKLRYDTSAEPMRRVWFETSDGEKVLLPYEEIDGYAIADGDILLGKIEDIEAHADEDGFVDKGTFLVQAGTFWPNAIVNYSSTSMLLAYPAAQIEDIYEAMDIWHDATGVTFNDCPGRTPRDPDTGLVCNDVVAFGTIAKNCASAIGRRGGIQTLVLSPTCGVEAIVHELGHTLGLFHEHMRSDRNNYVSVYETNLDPVDGLANYDTWVEQGAAGIDVAPHTTCQIPPYNFDSRMHYGTFGLAADPAHWPSMLRRAEANMSGAQPQLYKWKQLSIWEPFRSTGISNTDLGYGLFTADARTDIFRSDGGTWFTSTSGTGAWTQINVSDWRYRKSRSQTSLLLGDFDGNGRTDTMRETSAARWEVSWNGAGSWQTLNTDSRLAGTRMPPRDLATGDFNGDERTDILATSGGNWFVRYGGAGAWQLFADNTDAMPSVWTVGYGDFNGDDITDIFRVSSGNWQIYVPNTVFPTLGTWENYDTGNSASGPLAQNATAGSWSNSVALGDFDGNGMTDVLHTSGASTFFGVTKLDDWGWPFNDINILLSKNLTPLHFDNWNLNFVHTCKTLSSGTRAGERRCHSGPDFDGDGRTELISSHAAPVEPTDGKPMLSRGDIWSFCSRYPALGGKCASGGNWTTATCPQDVP